MKWCAMNSMQITAALTLAVVVGAFGGAVFAHPERDAQQESQQILEQDLGGEPGKEVVATIYTLPPHTASGWHIHPDAQEVGFVLQGVFRMEVEGQEAKELKGGQVSALRRAHQAGGQADYPAGTAVAGIFMHRGGYAGGEPAYWARFATPRW